MIKRSAFFGKPLADDPLFWIKIMITRLNELNNNLQTLVAFMIVEIGEFHYEILITIFMLKLIFHSQSFSAPLSRYTSLFTFSIIYAFIYLFFVNLVHFLVN